MIVDIVNGFLGSGKTTFIQNIIRQMVPLEKLVILVNEFGEIGIDGMLLARDHSEVVELTSGCVCCTLAADLGRQLLDIATRLKPDRVIIEPTGVATIQGLLSVVGSLRLEKHVEAIKVIFMVDAAESEIFQGGYPMFWESQIARADVVVINKTDLVSPSAVREIRRSVSAINGRARIIETKFGEAAPEQMGAPPVPGDLNGGGDEYLHHQHHHNHSDDRKIPDYQSFSKEYREIFDMNKLEAFFRNLSSPAQGEVIRAKGIFRGADGFRRIDYVPASGVTVNDLGGVFNSSRVLVIGRGFMTSDLEKKLQDCLA